jgi:hypothetical protein
MLLKVTPDEARRIIERLTESEDWNDHRLAGKLQVQSELPTDDQVAAARAREGIVVDSFDYAHQHQKVNR